MATKPTTHLEWVPGLMGVTPQWTLNVDLEDIEKCVQPYLSTTVTGISPLAEGAFNKLYDIHTDAAHNPIDSEPAVTQVDMVFRATCPVDPGFKTRSEVATTKWVQKNTSLNVPEIIAYEDSAQDSLIGCEWILMTKLPGKPLGDKWHSITLENKKEIVRQIARFSVETFRHQLNGIGNLHTSAPDSFLDATGSTERPGRIVSMSFFWGQRSTLDISRGPFRNSKEWLETLLLLQESDCQATLAKLAKKQGGRLGAESAIESKDDWNSDDEDELEDANSTLQIVQEVRSIIDIIFRISSTGEDVVPEPSMIFHDDMNQHNVLVDDGGALVGVVDWECVSALPLWKACNYPEFLNDLDREEKPNIEDYTHKGGEKAGMVSELYWEHLMEYERTVLRHFFLEESTKMEPRWRDVYDASQALRDLDIAVRNCDNAFLARDIRDWVADIRDGKPGAPSLQQRIRE